MSRIKRYRAFIFTYHNYNDDDEHRIQSIPCVYLIYGRELTKKEGPHLQGYIYFPNARASRGVERLICRKDERCWIHCADGDSLHNYDYTSKDDDYYFVKGERPKTSGEKGLIEKDRWTKSLECSKSGNFDDIPADIFMRYYNVINKINIDYKPKPVNLPPAEFYGVWIWGPPRTGKSYVARTTFPDAYLKGLTKWWCGYKGEDVVIIDEWHPSVTEDVKSELKKSSDRYIFTAEYKGGSMKIRPKLIIVTSNFAMSQCFDGIDLSALKFRFKEIHKSNQKDGLSQKILQDFASSLQEKSILSEVEEERSAET